MNCLCRSYESLLLTMNISSYNMLSTRHRLVSRFWSRGNYVECTRQLMPHQSHVGQTHSVRVQCNTAAYHRVIIYTVASRRMSLPIKSLNNAPEMVDCFAITSSWRPLYGGPNPQRVVNNLLVHPSSGATLSSLPARACDACPQTKRADRINRCRRRCRRRRNAGPICKWRRRAATAVSHTLRPHYTSADLFTLSATVTVPVTRLRRRSPRDACTDVC